MAVLAFVLVQCAVVVFGAVLHPVQQVAASHLNLIATIESISLHFEYDVVVVYCLCSKTTAK